MKAVIFVLLFYCNLSWGQISADFGGVGGGAVRFGESVATCNASAQGALRYESVGRTMKFCDGFTWQTFFNETCLSTAPTDWSFTNLASQTVSSTILSSIHQVTGITACTMAIKITGDGSPEYRICSDSACSTVDQTWGTAETTITNNKYVQLRLTTSATGNVLYNVNLTIGTKIESWYVRSRGNCADADPGIGTICTNGSVFVGFSPDTGAKTYVTECNLGRTLSGGACTGGATTLRWSGATILTGVTDQVRGETSTTNLVGLSNADSPYSASSSCDTLNQHGQTDWYLPSMIEAYLLFGSCDVTPDAGCSNTDRIWTSTESDASYAYYFYTAGGLSTTPKTGLNRMRCFRKD
jgi:hypothetical protein